MVYMSDPKGDIKLIETRTVKLEREVSKLHEITTRLERLEHQNHPIGSIFLSFLSEEQARLQMGNSWVLCDGRDVSDSAYHTLGYGQFIPDCRGRFLRSSGNSAAQLGECQSQATAVNGLHTRPSTVTRPKIKSNLNQSEWLSTEHSGTHGHKLKYYHYGWGDNRGRYDTERTAAMSDSAVVGDMTKPNWEGWISSEGKHQHYIPPHNHVLDLWIEGIQTAEAQSLSGDNETRPDNITVNTFIRINA